MNPEIILGPPGTGKTEALLRIVDEELEKGTPPERIGFVSFTRRAAREATERAVAKFDLDRKRFPNFRTLHSLCYRHLGLAPGDVLEGRALREFSSWAGVRLTGRISHDDGTTSGSLPGDRILHMENLARVRCVTLEEQYRLDPDDLPWSEVRRLSDCLQHYKRTKYLVDYTDMLRLFAESPARVALDVLLVDEAQDLSLLQWRVVEKLAVGCRRVVVAGDDDQAIYHWAGAALEHFVGMEGNVRVLGKSWRVPQSIQRIASGIISRVRRRRQKEWAPRDEEGGLTRHGGFPEVDLSGQDILVLARNTYVLRDQVEPILRRQGIIYEHHGVSSVPPELLGAIVSWERLRRGERILASEARGVLEHMTAGRGYRRGTRGLPGLPDDTLVGMDDLTSTGVLTTSIWHEALDRIPGEQMSYILAARRRGESLLKPPRVRLSTIHGSKGGEADHVVLLLEQARRTAEEAERWPEDEARVWYVAVTRARKHLSVVGSASKWSFVL